LLQDIDEPFNQTILGRLTHIGHADADAQTQ
jgi:hypothetical protein